MNNKKNSNNSIYIPSFLKKNKGTGNKGTSNGPSNAGSNAPSNAANKASGNVSNNAANGKSFTNKIKSIDIKQVLKIIGIIIAIIIVIYIIVTIVNYYQKQCYIKKSLFEYMISFSDPDPCIQEKEPVPVVPKQLPPKKTTPVKKAEPQKEVFHIANQDYTYDQAKCKCESYGGRLATKSEVTNAYNNGAHWCSYGWTDKQTAFYPVQQCEWDVMTNKNERLPDNEKKFCGMPGLNGGFFPNAEIKFGVNCYGVKPAGELSKAKDPYCPDQNFCKMEQNYQAANKLDTDEIVGFNKEQWSAIPK